MREKGKEGMGWFLFQLLRVYFWVNVRTLRPRLWMDLQWKRLWAKYPALGNDLLHTSVAMVAFVVLIIGSANEMQWVTLAGFIALAISLVLGTVNLIYDL